MKKRVIIIHGWDGSPAADWYQWLKKELERQGFSVAIPAMPAPETPKISLWVATLQKVVGTPDENTYLVGHSIGCQTILRYLEQLTTGRIGGALFVAGWFTITPEGMPTPKEEAIAKPWIETPINEEKVRERGGTLIALFSDDDPYVPLEENKSRYEQLGARTIVEHSKGHYNEETNIRTLPTGLKELLNIAR